MRIEPFDAATAAEATASAYAAVVADARVASTPHGLRLPAAYTLNRLRHFSPDHVVRIWVAYDEAGEMAGATELFWWDAPDNRNRSWLHLDVPASRHSDEVVDALASVAAAASVAEGRTLLNVETPENTALSRWVAARGGRVGSIEEHNVVRLRSLDRDDVAALAAAVPAGYELVSFDRCPEELAEAFTALVETMNTAPRDDLTMEDFVYTTERLRRWEDGLAARGHAAWNVVAREVATGELAAFNQLVVRPEWPECVENEDTAVAIPHRGRGLGLWIKAVNLLRVIDELPDAECIETWNAASNEHMLRVNRRLGFACEHRWESWELDAANVPAPSEPQPA